MPPFLLSLDPDPLLPYLRDRGWLDADESIVSLALAGDGNMNCTLRVVTATRVLVLKQGRPWVEKYPDIPAPPDRTLVEGAFYELVAAEPALAARMPGLIGVDPESRILAVENCGDGVDLTAAYEGGTISEAMLDVLLEYLAALHRLPVPRAARPTFANDAMRALNHEHIFRLPLAADAGLLDRLDAITPGLAHVAATLSADASYVTHVGALGEIYLRGDPRALVHGDFFPGSWLGDGLRVWVIDPEFCFVGAPEFDFGVMAAHLLLARQAPGALARIAAAGHTIQGDLVAGFAGVEIMRRLIGVGQLPRLRRTLAEKQALLALSRRLVLGEQGLDDV